VVSRIIIHGKIPMLKSREFRRWKAIATANAYGLVRRWSRSGTTARSNRSDP
jgi:hypothetical protein